MSTNTPAERAQTLLYMLLQRAGTEGGTLPPPGFVRPPWDLLAAAWDEEEQGANVEETVSLGPATVSLGHDDPDAQDSDVSGHGDDLGKEELAKVRDDAQQHEYGWDNEHPRRAAHVGRVRIEWRPITNGEFFAFWKGREGEVEMPKSWVEVDGVVMVRLVLREDRCVPC